MISGRLLLPSLAAVTAFVIGVSSPRAQEAVSESPSETGGEDTSGSEAVPADAPVAAADETDEKRAEEQKEEDGEEEEEGDEDHRGFFFRFTLGIGYSWLLGDGTLNPMPGLLRGRDPEHESPAFNLELSLGGGLLDLGIHFDLIYERMFLRSEGPPEMGVTLLGFGLGATYYFTDYDFYATAGIRLMGLLLYLPDVVCDSYWSDKYEWFRGPGMTLSVGKEWFGDDDGGFGPALQFNFARLYKDDMVFDYLSIMLVLTLTRF